jgi:magnesium transporter
MIRSIYRAPDGSRRLNLAAQDMLRALAEPDGLLWVSLERATEAEVQSILEDVFHVHPLSVEDTLSTEYQAPKVDNFTEYIFLVMHALRPGFPAEELDTMELDLFLGHNYLVTSFTSPNMPAVQYVWDRLDRDERLLAHGPDVLCHAVLDKLVDDYLPLLDDIDQEIDALEDEVLTAPQENTLQRILDMKHGMLTLRRIVLPQREVINRLSRDELPQISPNNRIYYRDIYDHLVRIYDLGETVRDVVTGTLDTYLSVTSNRLNEVMKTLTVVSTIFLPLSFVASVYGMNFVNMPELHWRYGYFALWGVFVLITLGMLVAFRRRGWI